MTFFKSPDTSPARIQMMENPLLEYAPRPTRLSLFIRIAGATLVAAATLVTLAYLWIPGPPLLACFASPPYHLRSWGAFSYCHSVERLGSSGHVDYTLNWVGLSLTAATSGAALTVAVVISYFLFRHRPAPDADAGMKYPPPPPR